MRDANSIRTLGDYSKPSHEGYRNTSELLEGNNVVPLRSDTICGAHDTQYCMENPEQAFVDYATSHTDEAGGKWFTFKPKQNNLGEMTNKIDTVLKAINDPITGALPSDTVKNPKLNVNSTSPVLFARSYPTEDPQCSSQESEEEGKEEKGDQGNINIDPPSPPDPSTLFITEKYDDPCEEEFGEDEGAATGESEFPEINYPPQTTDTEILQARGNLMETIQAFLKDYDHIPPKEKCMALLLAEERFLKIKQAMEEEQNQPEVMQEFPLKLMKDLQILKGIQPKQAKQEEPEAQNFLINLNFPMADDDEYTVIYRKPKVITPDLPIEEPDNSLNMGDEHLNTILETEKSSVKNLVPIPSEFKGISEDICDVPSCDNDHFDAECGLINSLLSRDILIASPKIDFLPEEFVDGEIDIDILQIEDEILREKLLNVNLLIDKIEALKLTPSIPFVLEYPSSSPIPVVDSDFLVEEVDTFLVPEDSIPPGIESDLDSEGDIVFLDNLLNDDHDDPIPEYERFTFDIEPDAPVINNFDELNEDECFDPGGGEIDVSQNIEDDDSFAFVIRTFLPYRTYPVDSPLLLSTGSEDTIFNPGIST
ncbi:hypothetical protein Tco_0800818 [Tanacetum coccineum]|uniref:Reverse transcriptase domain-containing protein n=1 Tax=Tanacetum coccineum TaxID=301880 RepID=A0ABQ4ZY10_9ASTR